MHKNAIDAAVRQGVGHIFYTSLAFGGDLRSSSLAFVMQAHLSTEVYLASLAASATITYTVLREGLYSESYPMYFGFFDPSHPVDEVFLPDDGNVGIAWAAREELGEATAKLIHQYATGGRASFPFINQKVLLSGPEALPLSGVAKVLGQLLGRPGPIGIKHVSVEEYIKRYSSLGTLDKDIGHNLKEWATVYEAIKKGECAVVKPTLAEVLGRQPEKFEQTIGKMLKKN